MSKLNEQATLADFCQISKLVMSEYILLGTALNLTEYELFPIQVDYSTHRERVYQILYHWRKKNGLSATIRWLFLALTRAGSLAAIDYITKKYFTDDN
jgi:hypothetical protein